ncbi:FACT complex subunit [Basidiobolus ranarum]|uniref:FACT complex subunit POB3 n=1 Tax=Basidiobolus ranarum TaxID=34480 RepID=A0ABR2WR85_9FUNG
MSGKTQFDNIYLGLQPTPGRLRLVDSGIGWKATVGEKIFTIPVAEIRKLYWLRAARDYELRIKLRNDATVKFDGFHRNDFETLKEVAKSLYKIPLEMKELSLKGWNWGKTEFEGNYLTFNVQNRPMFEVPMSEVANTNLAGKNEVSLEFMSPEQSDRFGSKKKGFSGDELVEMRFYIPGTTATNADGEEEVAEGEGEKEDGEEVKNAVSVFYETVKTKADLGQVTGESIVLFQEILCLTPRGRYDMDMFPTFLRLRGKTYDYKIVYNNIIKLFLLPKPDDVHVMFVIGLDPPIRQGQTRYPFLVTQFVRDEEIDVLLNLDDETIEEKYEGKLSKKYEAPTYEVISTIFRVLTGRKVTVPGQYRSHHGTSAVKASMKANEGFLYPLEKCFMFIPKPPTFIPHSEVGSVTFSRVGSAATSSVRTFDVKFNMKSGTDYQFSSINREEYTNLEEFLKSKKIKMKSELGDEAPTSYAGLDLSDSEEENTSGGRKRVRVSSPGAPGEEEEESPDEDFIAEDSDSDIEEEYNENYAGSDAGSDAEVLSDDMIEEATKSKK